MLTVDPLEGVRPPQEKNAKRPLATEARYRAALAQADAVDPRGRFAAILTIARHTGRRINAICQLRAADVCLTADPTARALSTRAASPWPTPSSGRTARSAGARRPTSSGSRP